jgi:hypothetical protein
MAQSGASKAIIAAKRVGKSTVFAKRVVRLASTGAVLKTHGHTLMSATKLKAKLDRQLAHAGGR